MNESVERFVRIGDGTVRTVVCGSGQPLLMINGIGAHVEMWQPLAQQLSRSRRLVMFDTPGCGKSSRLRGPVRMRRLAAIVAQLLDELELPCVDVLGYSWGGAVAQQLAHDVPDRIRRLVLASTVPGVGGQAPSLKVLGLMGTPLRYVSERHMRAAAPHIYGGDQRSKAGFTSAQGLVRWGDHPPTAVGYANQLFAIAGWSSLRWLATLNHRSLILCGDDDPLVPVRNALLMARAIPRSELQVVPGAGHLWLLDHAQESAEVIEAFLSS